MFRVKLGSKRSGGILSSVSGQEQISKNRGHTWLIHVVAFAEERRLPVRPGAPSRAQLRRELPGGR